MLQIPYHHLETNVRGKILAAITNRVPPAYDVEDQVVGDLLGQCWAYKPEDRPSVADILLYFGGINEI